MRTVAPSLGITPIDRKWQSVRVQGQADALGQRSLIGNPDYWYGKAGAFWFAYQDAIGGPGEHEGRAFATRCAGGAHAPFDGKWFMDAGEAVSGANLDTPLSELGVQSRDADGRHAAGAPRTRTTSWTRSPRAGGAGPRPGVPSDIRANPRCVVFARHRRAGYPGGNTLLDSYDAVLQNGERMPACRLPMVSRDRGARHAIAHTKTIIEDQRQVVQAYVDAAGQLAVRTGRISCSEGSPSQ